MSAAADLPAPVAGKFVINAEKELFLLVTNIKRYIN
jgi:hypothetical protein